MLTRLTDLNSWCDYLRVICRSFATAPTRSDSFFLLWMFLLKKLLFSVVDFCGISALVSFA
jgi:hypothetical protein